MEKFKVIFLSFFLVGCFGSIDGTPIDGDICEISPYSGAHFEVGQFELDITYPDEKGGSLHPQSFILKFRVPITDRRTKQAMTEAEFNIYTFENYNKIMAQQKRLCGENEDDPKNSSTECIAFKLKRCDEESLGGCVKTYTDAGGYISWEERYEYPIPLELKWIQFERVISNLGGNVVIPFAVNPWLDVDDLSSKFLDLTKSDYIHYLQQDQEIYKHNEKHPLAIKDQNNLTPPEELEQCRNRRSLDKIFKDLGQSEKPMLMHIPNLNINASSIFDAGKPDVFLINLDMTIKLLNQSDSRSEVNERNALSGSQFRVTPILLVQSGNSYKRLHDVENLTQTWTVKTTQLLNVVNEVQIPQQDIRHMSLALKVEPIESEASNIEPFYGLYDIPVPSSQLSGKTVPLSLKEEKTHTKLGHLESIMSRVGQHKGLFEQFFSNSGNRYSLKTGSSTEDLALKLERIRFVRVKSSGSECETPVNREVIYNIQFCLSNPQHNNLQYRNTPVNLVIEDMYLDEITNTFKARGCQNGDDKCRKKLVTDESGCVAFPYTMDHFPYNLQRYLLKRITFRSDDKNKAFWSENQQYVVLNPWEYGFLTYQNVTDTFRARVQSKKEMCSSSSRDESCDTDNFERLDEQLNGIISSENLKPPRIRINEYRSAIVEPSYIVEPSLDITTVKNIQFLIQPTIVRTDSIGETIRQVPNVLPVGHWVMRTILAKGPQEIKNVHLVRSQNPMESFYNVFNESFNLSLLKDIMSFNKDTVSEKDIIDISDRFKESNRLFDKGFRQSQYPRPYFSPEDYISHYDTVVKSENAVVSSFLEQKIQTNHFRHLGSKNAMIIEFYPLDNRGLKHNDKCELIEEKSNFAVMKKCEADQRNGNCHDLDTPAHWGLFSPSEMSSSQIVWPIKNFDSSKEFGIPALPVCENDDCSNNEPLALSPTMPENLFDLETVNEKFISGVDVDEATDRKYTEILNEFNVVDANDIFNTNEYKKFCENVEGDFLSDNRMNKRDLLANKEVLRDHKWNLCICGMDDEDIDKNVENGSTVFKDKIKQCKLLNNVALQTKNPQAPKINTVISEDICQFKESYTYRGEKDHSPSFLSYKECVCGSDSKWSSLDKTERMARCFSEKEGLVYANTSTFLVDFNRVVREYSKGKEESKDEDLPLSSFEDYQEYSPHFLKKKRTSFRSIERGDIDSMVQTGFSDVEQNIDKRSFLHAMCYYWFNDYYKQISEDHLMNFYKYHALNLAYLADTHVDQAVHNAQVEQLKESRDMLQDVGEDQLFEELISKNTQQPFKKGKYSGHPIFKCLNNPMLFFQLERKVIAGKLSSDKTKYNNGRVYTYVHSTSDGISSGYQYVRRESRQTKTGIAAKLGGGIIVSGSLDGGVNVESADSVSSSNVFRASQDEYKNITLAVNHINVDINLKKYRSCLVMRPRSSAFEDMTDNMYSSDLTSDDSMKQSLMRWPYKALGLIICDDEKEESIVIPEDYYYIHQFFGGHSYEFMSRTIYHNRPFIEMIRGQDVMDRFTYLANRSAHDINVNTATPENRYHREVPRNLLVDKSDLDKTLIRSFEYSTIDRTGFYGGIYTYPSLGDNYYYNPHITQNQIEYNKERDQDNLDVTQFIWKLGRNFGNWFGHSKRSVNAPPPEHE